MITSLRLRLCLALGALVLVTGLGASALAFRWAFSEAIELQDSVLLQVAAVLGEGKPPGATSQPAAIDAEARVMVSEIEAGDPLISTELYPDGFHTVTRAGEDWRVLVRTQQEGARLAFAQRTAYRDETARDSALQAVLPSIALIPLLLLAVPLVVSRTFLPLRRLARQLDAKQSDHMVQISAPGVPSELLPFMASINRLLERIRVLFDQQGRFIADAAHELRTPITALSLQAQNLEHAPMSAEARARFETVQTGIRRVSRLLDQLLTLARFDLSSVSKDERVAINEIAKGILPDLLPVAQANNIDLGFTKDEKVFVAADVFTLGIAIRNLIDNAVRYSPQGGAVDVSIERCGSAAVVTVIDSGPGIAEDEINRIFERFYRGRRSDGEGSGLGLSIVHRIATRLGGAITLKSRTDGAQGLRAILTLPAVD